MITELPAQNFATALPTKPTVAFVEYYNHAPNSDYEISFAQYKLDYVEVRRPHARP